MTIHVEPINLADRAARAQFASIPANIYTQHDGFVPPLNRDEHTFLNPEHNPFLQDNRLCGFIAWQGDRPVGRICAHRIQAHEEKHGKGVGFFGYTDWIDDHAVAQSLLQAASGWLLREGCRTMQGAYNFSINHVCGIQTGGFGNRSYIKTPFHPPHITTHLQESGFRPVRHMVCALHDVQAGTFDKRYAGVEARWPQQHRLQVIPLSRRQLRHAQTEMRDIYNDAYDQNWNALPSSLSESAFIHRLMNPLLYDGWAALALWDGVPAGMVVQIPNLDEAPRSRHGRISLQLVRKLFFKEWRTSRVPLLGVRRRFHGTRAGAMMASALLAHTVSNARAAGLQHVEYGWMLDDNHPIINLVRGLPSHIHKKYTIFERDIA